ncbi:MAG: 2-polyprenylphenol hydroxylase, partial [Devosia sp.]|nr:2-polyprenylphenol hydroxylase [Devosia sp.]
MSGGIQTPVGAQLARFQQASNALETTRQELENLSQSDEVALFEKQMALLRKRLLANPKAFRQTFITEGTQAIAWEFKQDELGEGFTKTLWDLLLANDDMSTILMRFLWDVPLKFKRKFVHALDVHLSGRYPVFKGLSEGWPAQNFIPPYVRPAEERAHD